MTKQQARTIVGIMTLHIDESIVRKRFNREIQALCDYGFASDAQKCMNAAQIVLLQE